MDAKQIRGWGDRFTQLMDQFGGCFARRDLRRQAEDTSEDCSEEWSGRTVGNWLSIWDEKSPTAFNGCWAEPVGTPSRCGMNWCVTRRQHLVTDKVRAY